MEITVQKRDLLASLDRVRSTIAKNTIVPILECFCFKEGLAYGYNGNAGAVTKCELAGMEFAINAELFYRVMYNLFDEVHLRMTEKRLHVASGTYKTQLGTMPTKGYPEIIPENLEECLDTPDLLEALQKVVFTANADQMRQPLLGISICGSYVYTSDGRRISRAKIAKPALSRVTVPGALAEYMGKFGLPDKLYKAGGLAVLQYKATKTVYVSNTFENLFPVAAVDQMLADTNAKVLAEFPENLAAAARRVQLLAQTDEDDLIVESTGAGLKVRTTSAFGSAEEEVPWPVNQVFKFAIKPRYLADALQRTLKVNLAPVLDKDARKLHFYDGQGFDHLVGLMTLKEG